MTFSMTRMLFLILFLTGCSLLKSVTSSSVESRCKRIGTTLNCARCGLSEQPLLLLDSNVTRLDLSKNDIRTIPDGSFEHMASLKMLNVSGNPLQDLNKESFRGLGSVEQFAIGSDYATKQWYFAEIFSSLTNVIDLRLNCLYPAHLERGFVQHMLDTETLTIGLDDGAQWGLIVYFDHLPATVYTMDKPILRAREDNNILYYGLSGTILPSHFSLHVGLEGCNISQMHPERHFPSLVYFDLQKNRLDISYFAKTTQVRSQLNYLDLGYNHIKYLPEDLISSLTSLQSVCFRGNPLVEITLDIKNNMKLELLDFSDCSLVNLTDSFMQQLDGLWSLQSNTTKQMSLSISNSRFDCTCSALAMIQWFRNTHVEVINKQSIYCTDQNGSVEIVDLDFSMMSEECKTPTNILMIILTPVASVTPLLVGIVLIHRYQWQLKWCVYKTKRRIRLAMTRRNNNILLEQVQFDAFIAHDHSDDAWVTNQLYDNLTGNHELELCLAQRDFLGGTPIAENIAHAINNSRKTVLVVTPAFVKSEWCLFEMHMAIAVKGMNHIVVILKEEVAVSEMGRTLRMILQTICYIEYPEEEAGLDLFWTKVVRAIKSQ